MSRFNSSSAYNFRCRTLDGYPGSYTISWTVDFHYSGSRCRFPRRFRRITDAAGAKRFCKKHGLDMPESKP